MSKKNDSLYKALIDSLFECKESLTKDELKQKIEEKGIEVKDIDFLMEFLRKHHLIVLNPDETYKVSVEYTFNKIYGK